MTTSHCVGLLSSRSHPLLPYFLDHLDEVSEIDPVLILDEKDFSAKDTRIFADRTNGAFPARDPNKFLEQYHTFTVPDHNGTQCRAIVQKEGIELLVNAGTPRILSQELIDGVALGILNAHPGILPKYRGASCCEWAIFNDDPVGVTAHFMDRGVDSGPIIFDRPLRIKRGQSYTDVRIALYHLAHRVRVEAIRKILDERLHSSMLPKQPAGDVFRPMPNELLTIVKNKLLDGEYRYAE